MVQGNFFAFSHLQTFVKEWTTMSDYTKMAAAIRGDMSSYNPADFAGIKKTKGLMQNEEAPVALYLAHLEADVSAEDADRLNAIIMEIDDIAQNEDDRLIGRLKHRMMSENLGELSDALGAFLTRYVQDVHGKSIDLDEDAFDDSVDLEEMIDERHAREQAEALERSLTDQKPEDVDPDEEEEEVDEEDALISAIFKPLTFEKPDVLKQRGIGTESRVGKPPRTTSKNDTTDTTDKTDTSDKTGSPLPKRATRTTSKGEKASTNIEDYYDLFPGEISNTDLWQMTLDLSDSGKERLFTLLAIYKGLELSTKKQDIDDRRRVLELIKKLHAHLAKTHRYGEASREETSSDEGASKAGVKTSARVRTVGVKVYRLDDYLGLNVKDVDDDVIREMFHELGPSHFTRAMKILQSFKGAKEGKDGNKKRDQEAAKLRKLFRFLPTRGQKGGTSYIAGDFFGLGIEDVTDEDISEVFANSELVNMERFVDLLQRFDEIKDNSGRGKQGERNKLAKQIQAFVREFASGSTGVTMVASLHVVAAQDRLDAPAWVELREMALVAFRAGDSAKLDQMMRSSEQAWAHRRYGFHACGRLRRMIRQLRAGVLETDKEFQARYFPPRYEAAA
jgi:hypothetical protein